MDSLPLATIVASIIGIVLRGMMRSDNDVVSDIGLWVMAAIFILGVVSFLLK